MDKMISKVNNPTTNIPKLLLKMGTEELSTIVKTISGFIENCPQLYRLNCAAHDAGATESIQI